MPSRRVQAALLILAGLLLIGLLCGVVLFSIGSSHSRTALPPPAFTLADLGPLPEGDAPWETHTIGVEYPFEPSRTSPVDMQALRTWCETADVRVAAEHTAQFERELQRPLAALNSDGLAFVRWSRSIRSAAWTHYANGDEMHALELLRALLEREMELSRLSAADVAIVLVPAIETLEMLSAIGRTRGGLPSHIHALVRRIVDQPIDLARSGILVFLSMRSAIEVDASRLSAFELLSFDPEETARLLNDQAVGCAAFARDRTLTSPTMPTASFTSRTFNADGLSTLRLIYGYFECGGVANLRARADDLQQRAVEIGALPIREVDIAL